MFIDKAQITVKAGNGGNGRVSFRREKFVQKGGPDGGDGGNGGSIIFEASRNENTLAAFRHVRLQVAESGQPGDKRRKHGKTGKDLIIKVPIGTVLINEKGKVIADLINDEQQIVIAEGGQGGYGNAHFVSSTRQAPKFAEKGEVTEEKLIRLEIKTIADVGLVGLPNAGKSTLLATISNAHPEIADYPFTTLSPNLGVVDLDAKNSFLVADIPGLIEGASQGKGLGVDFLRHIERTSVLIHLIDIYNEDILKSYKTIEKELSEYQINLSKRPKIIVLNKIDGLDDKYINEKISQLKSILPTKTEIFTISSVSKKGVKELLWKLNEKVIKERTKKSKKISKKSAELPILSIDVKKESWKVTKQKNGYMVKGQKIEKFAAKTDFSNEQSKQRIHSIMKKMGIMHELTRRGAKPGDKIKISEFGVIEY